MNANQNLDRCQTCGEKVAGHVRGLGWVHADPRQNAHGVWFEGDPLPADMYRRAGYGLPADWPAGEGEPRFIFWWQDQGEDA